MFLGRDTVIPGDAAAHEEKPCGLGMDRAEGEGGNDKVKLSKPQEPFILCCFSWWSISPCAWDEHWELSPWDGASQLLWSPGTVGLMPPGHQSTLLINHLGDVSTEHFTGITAPSFPMSILTTKARA